MRVVYMGTPEIAATILTTLLEAGHEIIAVVTQPDKPKGRGKEIARSAVKEVALTNNIPVYQPRRVREPEFITVLKALEPEIIIVAAFGQILSKEILELPPFGCINVHASLLPKYRGAAPIQWSIIEGEEKTGITIMHMDIGIDTGDMILKQEVAILPEETFGSLHDKLAMAGGEALLLAMEELQAGTATRKQQVNSDSSHAKILTKEMGILDFNQSAIALERIIRGLNPWPSAYTYLEGKTLKIWSAKVRLEEELLKEAESFQNGTIVKIDKDSFFIKTGEGLLQVLELQMEGKKRMKTGEYLRGYSLLLGVSLGK